MNNRKWLVIGICAVLIIAITVAWALLTKPGEEVKEPEVTAAPEVTAEPEAAEPDEAEPAAEGEPAGDALEQIKARGTLTIAMEGAWERWP